VVQTTGFCRLFEWAFGPRNFTKNSVALRGFSDGRGGFSTLSAVALWRGMTDHKRRWSVPRWARSGAHTTLVRRPDLLSVLDHQNFHRRLALFQSEPEPLDGGEHRGTGWIGCGI